MSGSCNKCGNRIRKEQAMTYMNSKPIHVDCMNTPDITGKKRSNIEPDTDPNYLKRTYIWNTDCWNCKKVMRVAYSQIEQADGVSITGNNPSLEIIKEINDEELIFEERYSKTSECSYQTSICPHCDMIKGRHYIHDEIFDIFSDDGETPRLWVKENLKHERELTITEIEELH